MPAEIALYYAQTESRFDGGPGPRCQRIPLGDQSVIWDNTMRNKKTTNKSSPVTSDNINVTDQALQVLMKEYDTLKDLFSQTEAGIQSIFNFDITLITAVVGGIALLLQLSPSAPASLERLQLAICGLLMLAAIIGTIYLLSIVARYAHLIEYGQGLDAVRLYLIQKLNVPMPSIYSQFLEQRSSHTPLYLKKPFAWLYWLLPTGSYQLTMAFINSCAFATATWILLSITGAASARLSESIITILVEFLLIFNIYNIYSNFMLHNWLSSFRLHLDPHVEHPFRMIR